MTMPQLLIAATCVYTGAIVATAYFTRATPRRIVGAIAGGVVVAVVGIGIEILCQTLGFWHYPSTSARYGPPLMYPLVGLSFATPKENERLRRAVKLNKKFHPIARSHSSHAVFQNLCE